MITREIAAPGWQAFFDEFSKNHQGALATVLVVNPDVGAQEAIKEMPLTGISFEAKGSERGNITLMMGADSGAHAEHRIEHPVHIWLRSDGDGESDALEFEETDNAKTILQLQPAPALPE